MSEVAGVLIVAVALVLIFGVSFLLLWLQNRSFDRRWGQGNWSDSL